MLVLQQITETAETCDFDCGNPGIETQIKDSYYASLLREGYAYEILIDPEKDGKDPVLVGYCMIKVVTLYEEKVPEEDREYRSAVYDRRTFEHAAIELTYLAINKAVQGKNIGTSVLKLLVKRIVKVSEIIPIRYIVLDALIAKKDFYSKLGFVALGDPEAGSETQFMFFDCLKDRSRLDAYIEMAL